MSDCTAIYPAKPIECLLGAGHDGDHAGEDGAGFQFRWSKPNADMVPAARLDAAHLEIATLNEALGVAMTRLRLRAADGDEGCAAGHPARWVNVDLLTKAESDLATARAEAETLRRERDDARAKVDVERKQVAIREQQCADGDALWMNASRENVALRESVRELVDGLATAKDSMLDGAAAVQRLILLHGSSAKAETLAARMRTKASEIESLLAKHAAPAPTPADAKETPAAVPGLVFGPRYVSCGEPRRDGVAVDGCAYWIMETGPDDEDGPWFWGNVDGEAESCATEAEAIAAASAHNAARLKGGE